MTTQSIAHPGADGTTAPVCRAPGAGVDSQPAGPTVLDALHKMDLTCTVDVLNPCSLRPLGDLWNRKHWGGGDACPQCVVREAIAGPTFATSTRSFEARPYWPSCMVHGCPEIGGWIVGSRGFRKLGDEKCIGLFCAEHMTERIAALDPMRFAGGGK